MTSRRRYLSGDDDSSCSDHCSPSPSPNPLPTYSHPHSNRSQTIIIVVIFSFITICFVLLTYYTILLCQDPHTLRRRRRLLRRRPPPLDLPVSHPPTHHVWLIRTVGLDAASIASLPLLKRGAGDPISGAVDCSVCLGEVAEGEVYRVLPKCGHVFHVYCIDTWLRAHVSCPVCRAPVVVEPGEKTEEDEGGSEGEGDRRVVRVRSDLGTEREMEMGRLRRSVSMGEVRIGFGGVGYCNAESSSTAKSEVEGSVPELEPDGSSTGTGPNGGSFLSRFRGRNGALL